MKKKIFIGLGLFGIAFTGAAFTAGKNMQTWHYLQKDGQCTQIIATNCVPEGDEECLRSDASGTYPVYAVRNNSSQCSTPLFEPENK